jgi:hypothetical protein
MAFKAFIGKYGPHLEIITDLFFPFRRLIFNTRA